MPSHAVSRLLAFVLIAGAAAFAFAPVGAQGGSNTAGRSACHPHHARSGDQTHVKSIEDSSLCRLRHKKRRKPSGIHKIKHVVIIMQENRSFDDYFGTYPGADGIPGLAGNPGSVPCVPDKATGKCVKPYHDTDKTSYSGGGPHGAANAQGDIDNGKMDGFVNQAIDNRCPPGSTTNL